MRGGGGQRAVSLNNKELSLKRKKDMRQVSGETGRDDGKMDWVTEGDDSKQVEPRSCEVVLKMTHPDTLPPCFFFFLLFSPLTCILFYILTLVHCINLLFFIDFPSLSLWVMFRAAARWNKTVCSSKMPRNKVFRILLETNIFWVCYCICVGRMYCVLVHTMRRHIQYLYYWMCVFVCIQKCLRQLKKLLYRILSLMVSTLTFSNLRCFFFFFF